MSTTILRLSPSEIAPAIADGSLRYSSVWEDHRLLERGLAIGASSDVLVIASAGCNALNLLLHGPRRLVALDFNPAQTALLELKLAAIKELSHAEFVSLIGIRDSSDRLDLYERVRPAMSDAARAWWDANAAMIAGGVERAGRLDRFIAEFRERHMSRVHEPDMIDRLLALDEPAARRAFARAEFFTPALEAAFRIYFTRESIGDRGRDGAQFRYVDDSDVGEWFWKRLQWVTTELPVRGNFFLERFLRGGLRDLESGPPYLRPYNYARLRALASRVEVVNDSLEEYLGSSRAGALSAAALSDLFEYMSPDASDHLFDRLSHVLRPGGRMAFWNLLVPREPSDRVRPLHAMRALSRALWQRDRSWFYRAFHVVEVLA